MGAQSPVDFSALLRSPPSSLSPVSHAGSLRSNTTNSSNSVNPGSSLGDTPGSTTGVTASSPGSVVATPMVLSCGGPEGACPKTREEVKKVVEAMGSSQFVEDTNMGTSGG